MKKAIVLGVGNAQVDLIRYLKSNDWHVIGSSYRHEGRGLVDIDEFALLNVTDVKGVEQIAHTKKADIVYSIGSDLAMPMVKLSDRSMAFMKKWDIILNDMWNDFLIGDCECRL